MTGCWTIPRRLRRGVSLKTPEVRFLPRNPSFTESGAIFGHVFRGCPDYRGFRCGNRKWSALVMGITLPRPGISGGCGEPEGRRRQKRRDCGWKAVFQARRMDENCRITALLARRWTGRDSAGLQS